MNIEAILAALQRVAPVIVQIANALKLNKLAAELVRRIVRDLVAAAAKTATPVDDALMVVVAAVLNHIADLLEANAVQDALVLLESLSKIVAK